MPRERISLEADKIDISSTQGIGTVKSIDSNIENRGALDYLSTSLKDNSLFTMFAINQANRDTSMFNSDATFGDVEKNDLIKTHRQHILPEYEDYLKDTKSKDEFFHKLEDISKRTYDKTVFGEQHPVSSFMLDVASETTNVPVYLGGLALASASAPITVGALASTFAGRAVLGATGEALMTGVKDYIGQKDQTAIDYAFNIAGGGLVAGVFKNNALMIDSSKKAMNRYLDYGNLQNKLSMQPKEKHSEIVKEHLNNISTDNFKNVGELMGKMKQWTDEGKLDPKLWEKFRVDTAYMMKGTQSDTLTNISKQLFKDSTLQGNDVDTKYGVELGTMIEDSIISKHSEVSRPITLELAQTAFGQGAITSRFGDAQNIVDSLMGDLQMNKQLFSTRDDFILDDMLDSVAFRLSKQTNIPIDVAKSIVLKANKASEEVFTFAHDRLASVKKKEFVGDSTVKKNPNYMPIIYDRNMAQKLGDKFVDFNIFKKFLTESMQSKIFKGAKLTAEEEIQLKSIIDVTAQKIWKNKDSDIVEGKSFDDILINTMVENGMTNEAIENLFKATGYADGSASKQNAVFARTRSPFDYSHKMEYVANGQRQTLSFMDLVDTNMGNVVNKYARKMGGNTALEKTKVTTKSIVDRFDRKEFKADFDDIMDLVKEAVKTKDASILAIAQKQLSEKYGDYADKILELAKTSEGRFRETAKIVHKQLKDAGLVIDSDSKKAINISKSIKDLSKTLRRLDTKDSVFEGAIVNYRNLIRDINNKINSNEGTTELYDELDNAISSLETLTKDFEAHIKNKESIQKKVDSKKESLEKGSLNDVYNQEFKKRYEEELSRMNNMDISSAKKDILEEEVIEEFNLDNDINIAKAREQIHRELAESNMSKSQADSALTRFDEIINELKGNPTASDPFGSMAQTERIISNMNIFRLLGQTGWTMSAEMASVAFEGGVKNFLNNSSMGALIKQFKSGKIDDKLAQEIQTWTGLGDQLNRAIGVNKYDHNYAVDSLPSNGQKVEKWLGKVEGVSEKLSEATLLFGGVKPLSAWLEMTYAKSMISQIIQMGTQKNPLSSNQIKQLQEMGFSGEMADKIFTQMKTHGNFAEKSWSNKHKVLELNFDKWDDNVRDMFIVGLRRKSHTVIQKSDMGDKFGATLENKMIKNTLIGRIALQLKDYMITSYTKQFGRAMNRKDAYMLGLVGTQLFALTMSDILQNITNYAGNKDELEEKLEFQAIADRVLHKMPQSSYIPMGIDMASMAVMNEPLVGEDRYGSSAQSAFMALPAIDFAIKLGKITGMPEHLISDGKLHNQDIDAISSLTGLNTYGTRTLKEMIKAENE